jgi:hypothetical protein
VLEAASISFPGLRIETWGTRQNVKAPTPGGGTDTDSNPAADVRYYSDSREQGHQVSPQLNNQQSAEGAEGAGNAAAMFQDFNECVNRVLGGH